MSEVVKEDKEVASEFLISISAEGRVSVKISGPHVNKTIFKRLLLALKKSYRVNINTYRKQTKLEISNVRETLESKTLKILDDKRKLAETIK